MKYPHNDASEADPLNPHPHGFTPALEQDGKQVSETATIAHYLTDFHPATGAQADDLLRSLLAHPPVAEVQKPW